MKAIQKNQQKLQLLDLPDPQAGPGEVLIDVAVCGICRTDLYVLDGRIRGIDPLIGGHEFSGRIAALGEGVSHFCIGEKVSCNPLLADGRFLGIDRNGAFAGKISVPEASVVRVSENLDWQSAAFLEPLAACLAVIKADLRGRGIIFGSNRIASLTARILEAAAYGRVGMHDPEKAISANEYEWIIETMATTESFDKMIRALKPGGRLIIKSRQHHPVALDLRELISREITLQAVNYADFNQAADLLAGPLLLDDLIGETYPLEEYERAFTAARASEHEKIFIRCSEVL